MKQCSLVQLALFLAAAIALTAIVSAGQIEIVSFSRDGTLVATNLQPGVTATVEWSPSMPASGWNTSVSETADPSGSVTFSVPTNGDERIRFFRVYAPDQQPSYSVNAVGYVRVSLHAGLNLIANPLDAEPDNDVDNILPLNETATGTTIYRFDSSDQRYGHSIQYIHGMGWRTAETNPGWRILDPGVGFFVRALVPQEVTFIGEVLQGSLSNPVAGGNQRSLLASQVPQEAPLGPALAGGATLEFPAEAGDTLHFWDEGTETWRGAIGYVGVPAGWIPSPGDGPTVPVATGFGVMKAGDEYQYWDREFSVN